MMAEKIAGSRRVAQIPVSREEFEKTAVWETLVQKRRFYLSIGAATTVQTGLGRTSESGA
jgi:hypothetical protein